MSRSPWLLIGGAGLLVMLAGCQTHSAITRSSHPALPKIYEFPSVDGFYPARSKLLRQQGTAIVQTCIGANGKFSKAPRIVKSTGFPRLDQAALAYIRATADDWAPALRNGVPIPYCHGIPVTFELIPN